MYRREIFNETIFQNLHGHLYKELFVTSREDIYDLMCGLHAYKKLKERSTGATDFHRGQPLQKDSNVNPIISLCVTINFIDTWSNTFDENNA